MNYKTLKEDEKDWMNIVLSKARDNFATFFEDSAKANNLSDINRYALI